MPRTTRSASAAWVGLALAVTLVLSGCGHTTSSNRDPSSRETPAANTVPTPTAVVPKGAKVIKGTGYSFAMPKGWTDLTKSVRRRQPSVDVAVGSSVQTKGFPNNMNVVLIRTSGTSPKDLQVDRIKRALADSAPGYQVRPDTTVAGMTTVHLSGRRTAGKQTYWLEQFVILGTKSTQVVSFSVSLAYPLAKRTELIDSVLKSWSFPQ